MSRSKILIIGGYGAVGRVVSTTLGNLFPGEVIVAGRNFQKAKKLSSELNRKVIPLKLDITSASIDDRWFQNVKLIIMCIDQKNIHFVGQCIKRRIHYIDISANYVLLSKIESLGDEAKKYGSVVVLSVGLAPGITNLLVKHCKSKILDMRYADIYIMIGFGEEHGEAALRWAFEDLNDLNKEAGEKIQVRSFEDGKQTLFPYGLGRRTAYRSNFSDQHVIPKTLKIDSVSTRMCFDSAILTWLYAQMKKSGLSKLLKLKTIQRFLIKFLKIIRYGSDLFVIKVEAGSNRKQGALYECSVSGNGEGNITGLVTAKVAEKLFTTSFASGVFHIEQLFNSLEFIESINHNSIKFEETVPK